MAINTEKKKKEKKMLFLFERVDLLDSCPILFPTLDKTSQQVAQIFTMTCRAKVLRS
jgi:hypothetical protein